jgi:hypothetical protein
MAKPPAAFAQLAAVAKKLAKTKPDKAYPLLFEAFTIVAAAGDAARAGEILGWMHGARLPPPKKVGTALSTQAIDGFCSAAGLGDRTNGRPSFPEDAEVGALPERLRAADTMIRWRITSDGYSGHRLERDAWRALPTTDVWRRINRWRDIQALLTPDDESALAPRELAALSLLEELLDELQADDRGAGYGNELVLALDLALRHGRETQATAWVARHGGRFQSEAFMVETALCLPAVAKAIAGGLLRAVIGLSDAQLATAVAALAGSIAAAASAPVPTPKIQKRRVSCEYSQLSIEPETREGAESEVVFFQDRRESEQGMSLFGAMVGLGTPSETAYVDAEVTLDRASAKPGAVPKLEGAVQAVAFPLAVRGPVHLRSVFGGGDDEPVILPPGRYDVLARFFPKKAPRAEAEASLRVYRLALSFRPGGSLAAPRCFVLEDGSKPPAEILVSAG